MRKIRNRDFNYGEYAIIRSQAGLNNDKISQMKLLAADHGIKKLGGQK